MIRIAMRIIVGMLLVAGTWLYAVRGEAILMDLQTMSARMLCL